MILCTVICLLLGVLSRSSLTTGDKSSASRWASPRQAHRLLDIAPQAAHDVPHTEGREADLGSSALGGSLKQSLRGDSEWLYPPDETLRRSVEIEPHSRGARGARRHSANASLQPVIESDEANRAWGALANTYSRFPSAT